MYHPVLIISDDVKDAAVLVTAVTRAGLSAIAASPGEHCATLVDRLSPQMLIVACSRRAEEGEQLIRQVRQHGFGLPVIALVSPDAASSLPRLIELRALVLSSPVSEDALLSYLSVLFGLGGASPAHAGAYAPDVRVGDLVVRPAARAAYLAGRDIELTAREFDVLVVLSRHAGGVVSRTQLLCDVWQLALGQSTRMVDITVSSLRRKLAEAGGSADWIRTVWKTGYRLDVPRAHASRESAA